MQQNGSIYFDSNTAEQYNPANRIFGGTYTLTEPDGTIYAINASSGEITSSIDSNGNVTSYGSGGMSSGSQQIVIDRSNNQITDAYNANDPSERVDYTYDAAGELIGVTDPSGNNTTYLYADQLIVPYAVTDPSAPYAANAAPIYALVTLENPPPGTLVTSYTITFQPSALEGGGQTYWYTASLPSAIPAGTKLSVQYKLQSGTSPQAGDTVLQNESWTYQGSASDGMLVGIVGPTGVVSLSADYDASGELMSLTNSLGKSAGVSTGGFQGDTANQGVTDLDGNSTQNIYDSYGNIIRTIQQQTDANGKLTGYLVTVHTYGYQQTQIDPLGNTTDSFYNSAGQLIDVYQPAIPFDGDISQMTRPEKTPAG